MPNGIIVTDGNSLTTGNGGQTTPWPTTAAAAAAYGAGVTWTNVAVGGRVTGTMLEDAVANVDAVYGSGPTRIVTAWELTNDIANGGAPTIHAFNRMARYCAERKQRGWTVIVGTMISRGAGNVFSGSTLEAYRLDVNAMIRAQWQSFADALLDIGTDSVFGVGGNTNLTYYQADTIHPTAAGGARMASLWNAAIAPFVT